MTGKTYLIDGVDIATLGKAELRALVVALAINRDALAKHISLRFIRAKPDYPIAPSRSRGPDPTKAPEIAS